MDFIYTVYHTHHIKRCITYIVAKKAKARNISCSHSFSISFGRVVLPHSLNVSLHLEHVRVMVLQNLVNQVQSCRFAEIVSYEIIFT